MDGRRARWFVFDMEFFSKPFGIALLERFGGNGVTVFVAWLAACKANAVQGRFSYANDADGLSRLSLVGLDLVDSKGRPFTLDDFFRFLGQHKQSATRRRGQLRNVSSTRWERWQEDFGRQQAADRMSRLRRGNTPNETRTKPERKAHDIATDLDLDLDPDPDPDPPPNPPNEVNESDSDEVVEAGADELHNWGDLDRQFGFEVVDRVRSIVEVNPDVRSVFAVTKARLLKGDYPRPRPPAREDAPVVTPDEAVASCPRCGAMYSDPAPEHCEHPACLHLGEPEPLVVEEPRPALVVVPTMKAMGGD